MRAAFVAAVALAGVMVIAAPTRAAPTALHDLGVSSMSPEVQLVRGGCGPGWHPRRWADRWGRWHVRCIPNRGW